jgi:hypothetical protein
MALWIPLETNNIVGDRARIHRRLQRIVGSVEFEIASDHSAFRILGPAVPYHSLDPCLAIGLAKLPNAPSRAEIVNYRRHTPAFDLCLEDSWSGYFVAKWLKESSIDNDIVLLHLDHHTDMMPLLLQRHATLLIDPTDDEALDVHSAGAWEKAIAAGSIGIGTFMTALFYLRNRLHVRHINNYTSSDYTTYDVIREEQSYLEIPDRRFAVVRKKRRDGSAVGTYRGGSDPSSVISDLPDGRIAVHIDLDYLINDFNGNPSAAEWVPDPSQRDVAAAKLESFFEALTPAAARVERWIVATSPGFCSGYHWSWLLARIQRGIERIADGSQILGSIEPQRYWTRFEPHQLERLRGSIKECGFGCVERALDDDLLERLQCEARSQVGAAVTADGDDETSYHARIGQLGPVARRLLESPETAALLQAVFGAEVVLTDNASCFTYYVGNDHLGLHRDRPSSCLVTLIVYLDAVSPDPSSVDTGLVLRVYARDPPANEPPAVIIPTMVGSLVIGRGSETWHERPRLQPGEHVVALTACFGASAAAD